jgi:hypothetical protein
MYVCMYVCICVCVCMYTNNYIKVPKNTILPDQSSIILNNNKHSNPTNTNWSPAIRRSVHPNGANPNNNILPILHKAVPLQTWNGPEGSRKLRFPDSMTTARDGGKVVSLTHRPPLPPGNTPGIHFC